jgi:hypothetical protein
MAVGPLDRGPVADGGQHIVEGAVLRPGIGDHVGGDDTDAGLGPERASARLRRRSALVRWSTSSNQSAAGPARGVAGKSARAGQRPPGARAVAGQ